MDVNSTVKTIKQQFFLRMNGETARSMREKGVQYHLNWGISLPDLKQMASNYPKDFDLAIDSLGKDVWIPVSESLPEEKTSVLVDCNDLYLASLNPCIGWRNGQYWHTFTANGEKQILYPVQWRPVPKSHKREVMENI